MPVLCLLCCCRSHLRYLPLCHYWLCQECEEAMGTNLDALWIDIGGEG